MWSCISLLAASASCTTPGLYLFSKGNKHSSNSLPSEVSDCCFKRMRGRGTEACLTKQASKLEFAWANKRVILICDSARACCHASRDARSISPGNTWEQSLLLWRLGSVATCLILASQCLSVTSSFCTSIRTSDCDGILSRNTTLAPVQELFRQRNSPRIF